jgi:gas vesicle protein
MRRILLGIALGCIVTAGSAAPALADSVGNRLSIDRNELRSEYRKVTKQLAEAEEEVEKAGDEPNVTGSSTAVWAIRNSHNDRVRRLRARESELRQRKQTIERDYGRLTRQAREHYGELPMWWEEDVD